MNELQAKVSTWLAEELGWPRATHADALSGGNSNLTWRFTSDEGSYVVRTTPSEAISPSSGRGIEREAKVLAAVSGRVKAPKMHAYCSDLSVIGRPFLVQECVDGVSITNVLPEAYGDPVESANALGLDLVTQLAAVHAIGDPDPALTGLGRPENFVERQIDRWLKVRTGDSVRELPLLFELGGWLRDNIPASNGAALTHGDYHLDNTLADKQLPKINAIIDWELATVGEPAMDVALALLFWGEKRVPQPPGFAHLQQISRHPGVVGRRELAAHWSQLTGRSIQHMDYYMALAAWRLAAIVEGAYCLYRHGKVSTAYAASLEYDVPALLTEAEHAAKGDW